MSVQTQIDRLAAAKTAIKTAIEGKGVTVPDATKLDGIAALIESIEAGGGGNSWTDNYTVFATGTFTPTESITEKSIDTGIPQNHATATDSEQFLIVWAEKKNSYGLRVAYMSSLALGVANEKYGVVVGYAATYSAKQLIEPSSFPTEGETVWTIAGLSTMTNFRANVSYRWMLLGELK